MEFMKAMKTPPKRFSPAAFWFLMGELKPEELRKQIRMMQEQGVHNAFLHARAYLKTPYLEEEWWKAISACIEESEKIDFYPWLYDEYAWPSGTAGSTFEHGYQKTSRVLAKGEKNMARTLVHKKYASRKEFADAQSQDRLLRAFLCVDGDWIPLQKTDADGEVLAVYSHIAAKCVDYMNPNAIQDFLECTHEEYKARYSKYFGNRIPGIFFDEIYMLLPPWTERFPEEFRKRRGYDILDRLPDIVLPLKGDAQRIRRDYYATAAELYEEAFFVPVSQWCKENNLRLTGHIEEYLERQPSQQGNFFNNMRHLPIPGADCHDYRYRFPRKITCREPKFSVAVARAYNKERAMSEALGGAGWGCSLQEFKRGINTLGAMGISMFILHGFHSECEHQGSQADWPSSFFYQNPYWRYFHNFADYMARVCYMNAQGSPVVDVGIFYPIDEMRMCTVNGWPSQDSHALNESFNGALNSLLENQIDVDMVDTESILRADVSGGRICVGQNGFRVLLCPETMIVDPPLEEKLRQFTAAGGTILYYACTPDSTAIPPKALPQRIAGLFQPDVTVLHGARDELYCNHREIEGKAVYFIANSAPKTRSVTLLLREQGGVQKLSPETGELSCVDCFAVENGTQVVLELEPDEACWLVLDRETAAAPLAASAPEVLAVPGKWEFLPLASDIRGQAQLAQESTVMEIPLAMFASSLHPAARQIRVCNRAGEKGYCGRHLSLWEGSWITRRPTWVDNSNDTRLYFRKQLTLSEAPVTAKLCMAAVNEWTLWLNGVHVADSTCARTPETVDIAGYLRGGENLLAVEVRNDTPLKSLNLPTVDELPANELISLLAQGEIRLSGETVRFGSDSDWWVTEQCYPGWEQPEFEMDTCAADAASCISYWNNMEFVVGKWLRAWERGKLPLLPWGDQPLFGEYVSYPQQLCYSITLPVGTGKVFAPELTGRDLSVTLDGMPIDFQKGSFTMKPDGNTHQLQLFVTVDGPAEGLHAPIKAELVSYPLALCDWRIHGLKWFSGVCRYRNILRLQKKPGRYVLNLGQTAFYTEVWVNGQLAGQRVWAPYKLDITQYLQDGVNELTVMVANAAGVERQFLLVDEGMALGWNRYWHEDMLQREGDNLVSGLIGPVQLLHWD